SGPRSPTIEGTPGGGRPPSAKPRKSPIPEKKLPTPPNKESDRAPFQVMVRPSESEVVLEPPKRLSRLKPPPPAPPVSPNKLPIPLASGWKIRNFWIRFRISRPSALR